MHTQREQEEIVLKDTGWAGEIRLVRFAANFPRREEVRARDGQPLIPSRCSQGEQSFSVTRELSVVFVQHRRRRDQGLASHRGHWKLGEREWRVQLHETTS